MSTESNHHLNLRPGSVVAGTAPYQEASGGSIPTPALQLEEVFKPKELVVRPVPHRIARQICEVKHYLSTYPGGSLLSFGIFVANALLGVAVLGVGPANVHRLLEDAGIHQVVCLTRFWLDDRLGRNCESRVLAVILRNLRRHQYVIKAPVAYSDPMAGGRIYHSRSLSHSYGTHSIKHFKAHGVNVELVPQSPKLTYVAFVDRAWQARLTVSPLPYPKLEVRDEPD